jgi:hypothetical protein
MNGFGTPETVLIVNGCFLLSAFFAAASRGVCAPCSALLVLFFGWFRPVFGASRGWEL